MSCCLWEDIVVAPIVIVALAVYYCVLFLCSWPTHRALLWAEQPRTCPVFNRDSVHGILHRQCNSKGGLLCKLQCVTEQCLRRSVFIYPAELLGKYSLLCLLAHWVLPEALKKR